MEEIVRRHRAARFFHNTPQDLRTRDTASPRVQASGFVGDAKPGRQRRERPSVSFAERIELHVTITTRRWAPVNHIPTGCCFFLDGKATACCDWCVAGDRQRLPRGQSQDVLRRVAILATARRAFPPKLAGGAASVAAGPFKGGRTLWRNRKERRCHTQATVPATATVADESFGG